MNLRIPGPTPLPPEAIAAVGQQMISHRGPQFESMFADITAWLKVFFETEEDVFILTSSGTGGMEAAVANTLSPGDRVLAVSCGVFGNRFSSIAKAFKADVTELNFPMGQPVDPNQVGAAVSEQGPFSALVFTQNETSTGVINDVEAISAAIRSAADPYPLILVDAISGLGAIRLKQDAWGVDIVISGSQKAWMAPPGVAMISFGQRAWEAYHKAENPRYYFDLGNAKKYAARNQTPATPNIAALYGLHASLASMVDEGIEAIAARHQHIGDYCRRLALESGLGLFAAEGHRSNTVTAVTLAEGMNTSKVLAQLRDEYDIHCGASKAPDVEMIRVGHMGYVTEEDLNQVFAALREIMAA